MDLVAVMQEVSDRLDTIAGLRCFPYPPDSVHPPAAIVQLPEDYTYDVTYGRGMDRLTLPVLLVVGRSSDRASYKELAAYAAGSGAKSIKAVLDADGYTSFDLARVMTAEFDSEFIIGGNPHLAAIFTVDIAGPGSM